MELARLRLRGQPIPSTVRPERITVASCFDLWLDAMREHGKRPSTVAAYESAIRAHVLGRIGGVRLDKVQRANIEFLQRALDRVGPSMRTRQAVHTSLRRFFHYAVTENYGREPRRSRTAPSTRRSRRSGSNDQRRAPLPNDPHAAAREMRSRAPTCRRARRRSPSVPSEQILKPGVRVARGSRGDSRSVT